MQSYIKVGYNHTICLTKNNNCYVWGHNYFGQLGLNDKNNRYTPTLLNLPNNEKITFITCGEYNTICLTNNDNCYVWGNTMDRHSPTILNLPSNAIIEGSVLDCQRQPN